MDYDKLASVMSSQYRREVLMRLEEFSPQTPSELEGNGVSIAHISRAIQELREDGLVELMVSEDVKKGRLYDLTSEGEEIAEHLREREDKRLGD